jgi:hypothetical protein
MAHQRKSNAGQRRRSISRTSPSGPTGDPARVVVEAAEFLNRTKGTLPEQIAPADLEKLNAGLDFLFSYLRGASEIFHRSDHGGRDAAIIALDAAWRFIALFKQPYAENLIVPILHLQAALRSLDENNVSPMLRPVRRPGRARSTDARAALRGHSAGTVARLVEAGILLPEAHALVAEALNTLHEQSERGAGRITPRTVPLGAKRWPPT